MSPFTLETPVGQMVVAHPGLARVFEKYGIDYCCGGKAALGKLAAAKGLDGRMLLDLIHATIGAAENAQGDADWSQTSLSELVQHIPDTHHAYLREELPRMAFLSAKVARVHGDVHPELIEIAQVYAKFHAEMEQHMAKEEQILFPAIVALDRGEGGFPVQNPIRVMEAEHDAAGRDFEKLRALSGGFSPPADACNSYRALFHGLAEMEQDLFTHIHKENNILFPRAIAKLEALTTA